MAILDSPPVAANAVVAADGSGDYTTITAAVAAVPLRSTKRYVIYIKKGTYNELVTVGKDTWNLTLLGDGMDATIISAHQSVGGGAPTTSKTGTFSVEGNGFVARDLTMENTAGPSNYQAVALLSASDNSVVHRCAIRGYQDTLYAKNTITAQSRGAATSATGFSFQLGNIYADDDLRRAPAGVENYLGRPWKPLSSPAPFSRVVFMECTMSDVIHPKGWLPWEGSTDVSDLYYGEYQNMGDGANVTGRVNWPGFHVIQDASKAAKYTVDNFIQGSQWIPATGVEYKPGL